ncbi:hypothetical protein C8D88_116100 [Lentzea atacamensis]|uniref:Uncharacterized protein n=1 Tax=Lentzea atacamensis TaxID=531938 RepID=A0A316I2P6_9PSEU|nr:hypothetical protein C8D88_116100 [Lentzea atacamensis]
MTPQEWSFEFESKQEHLHQHGGLTWFDALVRAQLEMEREYGERPKEAA